MAIYLAMYGNEVSLNQAFFISVFAMIVVFLVLLIISYLIDITAFLINGSKKKKVVNVKSENEVINTGVKASSDDLVAIIAAAVAAYLGTTVDNIRISKIRRVPQNDTPWVERAIISQIEKFS